jgi:hypothetical protein
MSPQELLRSSWTERFVEFYGIGETECSSTGGVDGVKAEGGLKDEEREREG